MEKSLLVKCLAQLGHETRISIFQLLTKAGKKGMKVGEIMEELEIPPSTLSHHLSKLTNLNLIRQEREGKNLICIANYLMLNDIVFELQSSCCSNSADAHEKARYEKNLSIQNEIKKNCEDTC